MRDQIELIEQDKAWLVLIFLLRATSVTILMTKGRVLGTQSQKQEKTALHLLTNISTSLKQKSILKLSIKQKEILFTQLTDLKH